MRAQEHQLTSQAGAEPTVELPPGGHAALLALAADISADLPGPLSIGEIIAALLEVGTCHLAEVLRAARRLDGGTVPYGLTATGSAAADQDGGV